MTNITSPFRLVIHIDELGYSQDLDGVIFPCTFRSYSDSRSNVANSPKRALPAKNALQDSSGHYSIWIN